MPNIFTPNGDGINEYHIPFEVPKEVLEKRINYLMSNIITIEYAVYNRWGSLVYFSKGVLPRWDGCNLINSYQCAVGTYYWILNYKDVYSGDYKYNGFVQLLR
tara:strand:- start:472 stop:780 length:309 start_codon:yes stop_codon:yes gene_type:complete